MLSAPTVSVFAPRVTFPPVLPPPDSEPIVSLVARLSVAPLALASTTAEASGRAAPPKAVSMPALIVVVPV